jgi:hypothetical protein
LARQSDNREFHQFLNLIVQNEEVSTPLATRQKLNRPLLQTGAATVNVTLNLFDSTFFWR